eukprot:6181769-Pleurochrysis_carterae.AAC.4
MAELQSSCTGGCPDDAGDARTGYCEQARATSTRCAARLASVDQVQMTRTARMPCCAALSMGVWMEYFGRAQRYHISHPACARRCVARAQTLR